MNHAGLSLWLWILASGCFFFTAPAQVDPCGLAWQRVNSPNSPGLLIEQASTYDTERQVAVLFGGHNPLTGVYWTSNTWEWDGIAWSLRASGTPPPRTDAAMAYDSARGVCVLFGGGTNIFQHEIPFNDTWEWNGSTWTLRVADEPAATNRPPPMDSPKMVYDRARRRVVLLGANDRSGGQVNPASKTWEWDGTNWFAHLTAPSPRIQPAMAYDAARRVTLLFGGLAYGSGTLLNDTWTWDGMTWTRVAINGPPPRDQHAMAFDARRRLMVLFGGAAGGATEVLGDTWEWDGQAWTERPFAGRFGLTPRRLHHMWYDAADERVIVFGGTWSRRNGDGSYDHFILDELWGARPPGLWIDFNYSGVETGDFNAPYNTLAEGVNAASTGCVLHLKAGSTAETLTISKQLRLEAYNGQVTIGQ